MNKTLNNGLVFLGILGSIFGQEPQQEFHPRGEKVRPVLESLTANGVPGANIAIFDLDGWWTQSSGYSDLKNAVQMTDTHLHYLQSVAKTYMAVAVLKLYEEGKLSLGDKITKHLNTNVSRMITRADEITIQMLLNHTSGIPEYNFHPEYASRLLQHPDTPFKPIDYIKFIAGKKLDFEPGSKYSYRNTNYVLLTLIVDNIIGDHGKYIEEVIFKPLKLEHTYYQINDEKLSGEFLTNSYWDRYSDGYLEDISYIQKKNVTYMVGDDGIVATIKEAIIFLRALLEGKLLKSTTVNLMKEWVHGADGKPAYGLGLAHNIIAGKESWGHSGGGIGAGCELRYFPEADCYVFVAINIGTVTYSPLHLDLIPIRDKIFEVLLE